MGLTGGVFSFGLSLPAFVAGLLAGPLVLAAFISSIVGMCMDRAGGGVMLLIGTMTLPSATFAAGAIASVLTAPQL